MKTVVDFDGDYPPRREIADDLKQAARASILHCQALVDNVNDINAFKEGRMELSEDTFKLHELCEEVGLTMRHAFSAVPQIVKCADKHRVVGSRRHLKQVLQARDNLAFFLLPSVSSVAIAPQSRLYSSSRACSFHRRRTS